MANIAVALTLLAHVWFESNVRWDQLSMDFRIGWCILHVWWDGWDI